MSMCALVLSMSACKSGANKNKSEMITHNSQNSLDWQGTYYGVLPCADCPAIEIKITLNPDGTYQMSSLYREQEDGLSEDIGKFQWSKDGSTVALNKKNGETHKLKVGENKLFWLDNDGKMITGESANNYVLNKVNSNLLEKRWKLTEIFGEAVTKENASNEAFMVLHVIEKRVNGNLGCNSFFGSYELSGENRIKFSQVGSTMMMCQAMEVESKMKQALEQADSYYVQDNTLTLNRARMAPLAKFVAVQ